MATRGKKEKIITNLSLSLSHPSNPQHQPLNPLHTHTRSLSLFLKQQRADVEALWRRANNAEPVVVALAVFPDDSACALAYAASAMLYAIGGRFAVVFLPHPRGWSAGIAAAAARVARQPPAPARLTASSAAFRTKLSAQTSRRSLPPSRRAIMSTPFSPLDALMIRTTLERDDDDDGAPPPRVQQQQTVRQVISSADVPSAVRAIIAAVEMLADTPHSFAMANAHPDVIDTARYLAPTNREHGVLRVLERLLAESSLAA